MIKISTYMIGVLRSNFFMAIRASEKVFLACFWSVWGFHRWSFGHSFSAHACRILIRSKVLARWDQGLRGSVNRFHHRLRHTLLRNPDVGLYLDFQKSPRLFGRFQLAEKLRETHGSTKNRRTATISKTSRMLFSRLLLFSEIQGSVVFYSKINDCALYAW